MTNGFYNHSTPLTKHTIARAEAVNAEFDALAVGFDRLPTETEMKRGTTVYAQDTGTANAVIVQMPHTLDSYTTGMEVVFKKIASASTGAATINIDGVGVKSILRYDGSALSSGDLPAGAVVCLRYDGTAFRIIGPAQGIADAAAVSAAAAAASALAAGASETASGLSETAASASASSASGSASTATTQAGIATTQAVIATTKAGEAAASAVSADASATVAGNAGATALNARDTAVASASAASSSESNALTYKNAAQSAQTAAEAARDATLAAYDNFDDRYLGAKASNPTTDNDGNALLAGSLYYNTTVPEMRLYTGAAWVAAYVSGSGYLASANNLSDLASAPTARTNLGLGTAATSAASAFATSAQGAKADTALQSAAIGVTVQGYDATILKSANIGSTVQGYDAATVKYNVANVFSKQQTPLKAALTDAATVAWDCSAAQVATLTLTAARAMGAPTNQVAGTSYRLVLTSAGFTPSWNAVFKFPGGTVPSSLTGTCIFDFYSDGTNFYCVGQNVAEA